MIIYKDLLDKKAHICKKNSAHVCWCEKVGLPPHTFFYLGEFIYLIKKGLVGLSPVQLGASRILMTTIILLLVGFKSLRGWSREQWKWMTFTGFFGTFFPSFLFAFSETEINSSVVAVLNGLTPFLP